MQINTPNKCSCIVVDYRTDHKSINTLKNLGYEVVLTKKIAALYEAVDGHGDMQLFKADNNIIVAKEAYDYYKNIFKHVVCAKQELKDKYPYDVLFNCACVNDFIICNQRYIAKEITDFAAETNKTILNVKQGYSKCSTAVVGTNAVITADKGIYDICRENKIDALKITEGHIELKGLDYGFIGGCCGMLNETTIAFNGELNTHPQGNEIRDFCNKHGIEVIELKKGHLTDIGSIISI